MNSAPRLHLAPPARERSAAAPRVAAPAPARRPRVITVASGKGGVGKTHLSVNLATALAEAGKRVLLVDADLGLANVNVLLGMSPERNASHLLEGHDAFEDVVTRWRGLFDFLAAGSALVGLAELDMTAQVRLLERLALHRRDYDFVLVDAGAGIGGNVRLALGMADEVLVVMNPETTSLTDAYALVKVAVRAGVKVPFQVVVNRVRTAEEARDMFGCLSSAARSFLGLDVHYAGYVYRDRAVERAMREQAPFVQAFPGSPAARCVEALARRLAGEVAAEVHPGGRG